MTPNTSLRNIAISLQDLEFKRAVGVLICVGRPNARKSEAVIIMVNMR